MAAIRITRHARQRLRGRMGISASSHERMAERVLRRGVPVDELEGQLRSFVEGQIQRHGRGAESRVYGEALWVIDGGALITVYLVPRSVRAVALEVTRRKRAELSRRDG